MVYQFLKILLSTSVMVFLLSCHETKEVLNLHEVEQGMHLEKAEEIKIDKFISLWIDRVIDDKRGKIFRELYTDSTYSYFGTYGNGYTIFNKILNTELSKVNYISIDGWSIKEQMKKLLSDESKKKIGNKGGAFSWDFTYNYLAKEEKIIIHLRYRFRSSFRQIVDENYSATYSIVNKTLIRN